MAGVTCEEPSRSTGKSLKSVNYVLKSIVLSNIPSAIAEGYSGRLP